MVALTRERTVTLAGVFGLCVLAWAYLLREASSMSEMAGMAATAAMSGMPGMEGTEGMEGMGGTWTLGELGYLFLMWSIMMVAMMLPATAPTIMLVGRVDRSRREQGRHVGRLVRAVGVTPVFVAGYLLAWTSYSALAAAVQWVLHGTLLVSEVMVSVSPVLTGGLLVAAGAYQFTPLKHRCITHCRSPLSFLTAHWREGTGGALRMGLHHGSYCVGCCWALMALLFVLGVMNLLWVTALAVLVLVEKTLPGTRWVTWGTGAALLIWGAATLLAPAARALG